MRKVIMWNMVTLDGFFEGPKSWDISWHEYVWGEELERYSIEQSKSIGMLLFGRVTYQGMAAYWSSATGEIAEFMNSIPKVVFSRTLERAEWSNTWLVKANAEDEVPKLKQQPGKDLFIFGMKHRRDQRCLTRSRWLASLRMLPVSVTTSRTPSARTSCSAVPGVRAPSRRTRGTP